MRGDPPRWVDTELPEELRSVLRSATEDEAGAAQLERLRKAVEGAIGPAAFEVQPPRPGDPAATSGIPSASTWANASQSLTSALPWALTAIAAIGLATLAARWRSEPHAVAETTPQVVSAPAIAHPTEVPAAPTPVVEQPPSQALVPSAPAPARPPAARPTLAEELASLDRIRARLQTPDQARIAVRRHAALFREGALIPERQLLELEIALRSGQTAKAKRLSRQMLRENSAFPYRARARKLLADFGS